MYHLFLNIARNLCYHKNKHPFSISTLQRYGYEEDADSPHNMHDYIVYKAHEETLMKRYDENKDMVVFKIKELLPDIDLAGQWSVDVMQNGDDFWIIDMALAVNSALVDCVPPNKLKPVKEDWLPKLM